VWGGYGRGGVRSIFVKNTSEKTCLGRNSHGDRGAQGGRNERVDQGCGLLARHAIRRKISVDKRLLRI
jgi:hypothetical protein